MKPIFEEFSMLMQNGQHAERFKNTRFLELFSEKWTSWALTPKGLTCY